MSYCRVVRFSHGPLALRIGTDFLCLLSIENFYRDVRKRTDTFPLLSIASFIFSTFEPSSVRQVVRVALNQLRGQFREFMRPKERAQEDERVGSFLRPRFFFSFCSMNRRCLSFSRRRSVEHEHSNRGTMVKEAGRNQRIKMLLLLIALGFLSLLIAAWFLVTQPLLLSAPVTGVVRVEPQRLEAHVRMLSETLHPRDEGHPANLDRVAAYIRKQFESANGKVSEQPFAVEGITYRNVLAQFGPDTKERIVVGAHYDSAGALPGADDNASGVAGLIELAYLLGKAALPMRVELVAFTLEEPPFFRTDYMGSAIHAASLKQQGVKVRLMFSLEMIGYFSDAANSQRFPVPALKALYPSRGNFIAVVGKFDQGPAVRRVKQAMSGASSLPVYSINAPRSIPGIDFSDHLNYWDAGYNAVMVTDTAFYRNSNYHTLHDTADTLDYQRMAMVVEGVYAAVLQLAK